MESLRPHIKLMQMPKMSLRQGFADRNVSKVTFFTLLKIDAAMVWIISPTEFMRPYLYMRSCGLS